MTAASIAVIHDDLLVGRTQFKQPKIRGKQMTNYEIVKKLIGPITAIGEHNTDQERFKNLEATIQLVDELLEDITDAAHDHNRVEASMKKIGNRAKEYLSCCREHISY